MIPSIQKEAEANSSPLEFKDKKNKKIGFEKHFVPSSDFFSPSQPEIKKRKIKRVKSSTQTPRPNKEGDREKKKEKISLEILQNLIETSDSSFPIKKKESSNKKKEIPDIPLASTPSANEPKKFKVRHLNSLQTTRQKKEINFEKKQEKEKSDLEVVQESVSENNSPNNYQGILVDASTIISSSKSLKEDKGKCHSHANQDSYSVTSDIQLKEFLNNCHSLTRVQIYALLLFIIKPAYPILHELCKKLETEEHIEFLLDYVNWSQMDYRIDLKSYTKELKAILKTYIKEDAKRAINIDHQSRKGIIEAFKKNNYDQVENLMKQMSRTILSLLWNNVFYEKLFNDDIKKRILNSI